LNEDKKKLLEVYKKGLGVLFLFSLPFVLVLGGVPKLVISLAYGQDYLAAMPAMMILGFSLILFFLNALPGNIIQNSPQFKQFLPWALLNFIITLVLCLILIPRYSIVGAAWAVMGGEVAGLVINNWFVFRLLKK